MTTKKSNQIKIHDGTKDYEKLMRRVHRLATDVQTFADTFNTKLKDTGLMFDQTTYLDFLYGKGNGTISRGADHIDMNIPAFSREAAYRYYIATIHSLVNAFSHIDRSFDRGQVIPKEIARALPDFVEVAPDGNVRAKDVDPKYFDIYIDAEAYDVLVEYVSAQRRVYDMYGNATHTITQALYEPGDISEFRATIPRCHVDGIERIARYIKL